MNQSANTQGAIPQNLKEEAETLLQKHCHGRLFEAFFTAKRALDCLEDSLRKHVPYRSPADSPWITDMMQAALMPDGTICKRTVRNHAVSHSEMMIIQTGPTGSHDPSLELLKAMEDHGCIWGHHGTADEHEEPYYYAELTGYGLAKFLGIDLNNFMSEQRTAFLQAA